MQNNQVVAIHSSIANYTKSIVIIEWCPLQDPFEPEKLGQSQRNSLPLFFFPSFFLFNEYIRSLL